ncbi:MAG: arginine repressor [Parasporobacterium sp.]|nr:arginine repressor [Parasporobacterium sp.]
MKSNRHEKIIELISRFEIDTQEKLASCLRAEGFQITQATVSRDINELNLIKVAGEKGSKYALPESLSDNKEMFSRVLKDGFVSITPAGSIAVMKTLSGMGMAVAAALDSMDFPENIGTIGGDDTIFCACRSHDEAIILISKIKKIIR